MVTGDWVTGHQVFVLLIGLPCHQVNRSTRNLVIVWLVDLAMWRIGNWVARRLVTWWPSDQEIAYSQRVIWRYCTLIDPTWTGTKDVSGEKKGKGHEFILRGCKRKSCRKTVWSKNRKGCEFVLRNILAKMLEYSSIWLTDLKEMSKDLLCVLFQIRTFTVFAFNFIIVSCESVSMFDQVKCR